MPHQQQGSAAHRYETYKSRAQAGLSSARDYAGRLRKKYNDELPVWDEHINNQNQLSSSIAGIKSRMDQRSTDMDKLRRVIKQYGINSPSGQKARSDLGIKQKHQDDQGKDLHQKKQEKTHNEQRWTRYHEGRKPAKSELMGKLHRVIYEAQHCSYAAQHIHGHGHSTEWEHRVMQEADRLLVGDPNPRNSRPMWQLSRPNYKA